MNIPNQPTAQHDGILGSLPTLWYGSSAPDADGHPWVNVPVGSLYFTASGNWLKTAGGWARADSANGLNVKAFGAVGDGVADDTVAIQAAITAASAANGSTRVVFFEAGIYRVTDTLQIDSPGVVLRGVKRGSYTFYGGSEIRLVTTDKALIQIGTDSGNAYDTNEYDGPSGIEFHDLVLVYNGATFTALTNGTGLGYGAGTIGVRDWRGGSIWFESVELKQFEYGFWGIQSDINDWQNIDLRYNKTGVYLGPRSDQNTLSRIYSLYNDRALWIDGVFQARFRDCQFVGDGATGINPIKIGSEWARLTENIIFDGCWFEHQQGVATIEAFIDLGVSSTYAVKNVVLRDSHVFINPQAGPYTSNYFVKIDNADYLHIHNYGKASAMGQLAAVIRDIGDSNKNMTVTADAALADIIYSNGGASTLTPLFIALNGSTSDGFYLMRGSTGQTCIRIQRNSDSTPRLVVDVNGRMTWGDGAGNSDTVLYRNAANVLKTDDALIVGASTTTVASLNIPHGTAPSSPVNGDMWTTTAGLFVRINGSTVGPLS